MKVALVYDRVNKWGGAERVLLALHKLLPDAPLYTSVYDSIKVPWANVFDPSTSFDKAQGKGSGQGVRTSFLQKLPLASSSHELYASLMPLAFESFTFDEYDLVISVTSEAAKGIITKPKTVHICYCLTPTRYLWSGYEDYFNNSILRFVSKPAVSYLRRWDKIAAQRPDVYIAISKEVQRRIKKFYGRESVAVYPPVDSEFSSSASSVQFRKLNANQLEARRSSYFLIVSRLVPYKKIDIAISAFNKLKLPLKVIGTGSQRDYLKSISGSTIEFLGNLTDEQMVSYYRGCRALIFPGIEDFGLTILEAQSFGKPVIAFRNGGALETIIEGKTGEFFYPQNEKALIKKIKGFKSSKYDPLECLKNAKRFSYERFKKEFMDVINRTISNRKTQIAKLPARKCFASSVAGGHL